MTVLAFFGGAALLAFTFWLGIKAGAWYMADITAMAAIDAGVNEHDFSIALAQASRDYANGRRPDGWVRGWRRRV